MAGQNYSKNKTKNRPSFLFQQSETGLIWDFVFGYLSKLWTAMMLSLARLTDCGCGWKARFVIQQQEGGRTGDIN